MPTAQTTEPEHAVSARLCAEQCHRETRRMWVLFSASEEWPEAEAYGYVKQLHADYFVFAVEASYEYTDEIIYYDAVHDCEAESQ